jgi:hypothetical protein
MLDSTPHHERGGAMRVLVATNEAQDRTLGDYCFTVEGELVTPIAAECDDGDECGCSRGFPGLASDRATTTAKVVDNPTLTHAELTAAVRDALDRGGWLRYVSRREGDRLVRAHVGAICDVGRAFPEGAVVRRRGDRVSLAA